MNIGQHYMRREQPMHCNTLCIRVGGGIPYRIETKFPDFDMLFGLSFWKIRYGIRYLGKNAEYQDRIGIHANLYNTHTHILKIITLV